MKQFLPYSIPERFVFRDPDTKHAYSATTKQALITQIVNYREQNRLPVIDALPFVLENYWCSLPENAHKCKSVPLRRGWFQTLKGGIALFENLAYKKMVSPQVAEERAKICIACPHNIFPDKGAFIEWSDKIAEASTGGLTTPLSGELGNCEVCSCPLRAKIFYGGKITVTAEQREKMQKVNCWQIK